MTTKGPCRSFSFFDSAGLPDVLQALEAEGVLVIRRYWRVSSLKHSGWSRCTAVTFRASGLSTKIGMLGMRFSLASWCSSSTSCWVRPTAKAGTMMRPPRRAVRLTTSASLLMTWLDVLVEAAAVGALHDQVVGGRQGFGIADDGQAGPAHVAGEGQAHGRRSGRVVQHDVGRAQDVAGIVGLVAQARRPASCGSWYGTGRNSGRVCSASAMV